MKVLKRIAACTAAFSLMLVSVSAAAYNDVPEDYQYGESIAFLTDSGIVKGDGNGNFAPKELLTRAEFVTMLDAAFDIGGEEAHSFNDVPSGVYYEKPLGRLQKAGIVSGKEDGFFAPNDSITHEEAVKMIVSAYEFVTGTSIPGGVEIAPADYKSVSTWAKMSMDKAIAYRIPLISEDNILSPTTELTRGEAAELVTNALLCLGEPKQQQGVEPTKVIQNKLGNVYYTTEPAAFEVSTGCSLIGYEVRDYYNMIVRKGYAKARGGTVEFDFTDLGIGYYSFIVYSPNDNGTITELCKTFFCIIDEHDFTDINPETAKFGINTFIGNSWNGWSRDLLELAGIAGAKIIRNPSWWANVESVKGVYNSDIANNAMEFVEKFNMAAMDLTIQTHPLYDNGATPWSEDGINAMANYANALADCWNGNMKWIDVMNEFEVAGDIGDGPADCKPESLYNIVKRCYEVVKQDHPEVKVGVTAFGNPWDEEFFKLGALNYLDYVAAHEYPHEIPEGRTEVCPEIEIKKQHDILRNMIDKYNTSGHEVELLLNETGGHTSTALNGVTYRQQAEFVPRIMATALAAGHSRIIWFDLMNEGHDENINENNYGLFYNKNGKYGDYAPKPSFQAYCVLTRKLARTEVKETISDGNIYQYVFTTEDGKDLSVLNALDGADVALYTDEPVKVTDIVGREEVYTPVNGKIYLTLDTEPLYIEGAVTVKEEKLPVREEIINTIVDSTACLRVEADEDLNIENITAELNGEKFGLEDVCYIETDREQSESLIATVIKADGKPFARLKKRIEYKQPYDVSVKEKLSMKEDMNIVCDLDFTVQNNMDEDIAVNGIRYNFGDREGIIEASGVIPAKESMSWQYSFDKLTSGLVYNARFSLICDELESKVADFEGNYDYNVMPMGNMVIDGNVDTGFENLKNCLFIPPESMVKAVTQPGGLIDKADYDAQAWVSYDDKNLYICVDAVDDKHCAPATGGDIWSNDSIQFALFADEISELKTGISPVMDKDHYYELGVSLLDSGLVAKHCWNDFANGWSTLEEHDYNCSVKRDETTKHTVYELEIPWNTIYPLSPESVEDLRMSIAVVDNDGNGRDGWLEWGGGICYSKDPTLFKHIHLFKK